MTVAAISGGFERSRIGLMRLAHGTHVAKGLSQFSESIISGANEANLKRASNETKRKFLQSFVSYMKRRKAKC